MCPLGNEYPFPKCGYKGTLNMYLRRVLYIIEKNINIVAFAHIKCFPYMKLAIINGNILNI